MEQEWRVERLIGNTHVRISLITDGQDTEEASLIGVALNLRVKRDLQQLDQLITKAQTVDDAAVTTWSGRET